MSMTKNDPGSLIEALDDWLENEVDLSPSEAEDYGEDSAPFESEESNG